MLLQAGFLRDFVQEVQWLPPQMYNNPIMDAHAGDGEAIHSYTPKKLTQDGTSCSSAKDCTSPFWGSVWNCSWEKHHTGSRAEEPLSLGVNLLYT